MAEPGAPAGPVPGDFFEGLGEDVLAALAACAHEQDFPAGAYVFREGMPAEHFYVVRTGRVALELASPGGRGPMLLDTVDVTEVLGWSWLVPPYAWFSDARAVEPTRLTVFDAAGVRAECERDPRFGYALLARVAQVMYHRLQAARVRLLDLYGPG